jgi:hypothetical protein
MRNKIVAAALVLVAVASVAYAAFSQNLTINGTGNASGNWDVEVISITKTSGTGESDHNSVAPSFNATSATFNVDLAYPGATATYDVVMKNKGNINAKVSSIPDLTATNAADPADVKFTVTGPAVNDPLTPGSTVTATVTVTWLGTATTNVTTQTKNATITYGFAQNT